MADYYRILGVESDASSNDIKRAFRRLARETHPDANPDDPEAEARFRQIAEAYEVLSDPQKRAAYERGDQLDPSIFFQGMGMSSLDDILQSVFGHSSFFGSGMQQTVSGRGRDVRVGLTLTLEEAAFGAGKPLVFRTALACDPCEGAGSSNGSGFLACGVCGGQGQVRRARQSFLGSLMTVTTCQTCQGEGSVLADPCEQCFGEGVQEGEKSLTINIPPGVEDGNRLRMAGEGEAGRRGGYPGDLHIDLHVAPHPQFERVGHDLVSDLKVGMVEAALGTEMEAPLLEGGTKRVKVPSGSQHGETIRIPNKGVTRVRSSRRGDLYLRIKVEVPTKLNRNQRKLLQEYSDAGGT
ncbi:MAG: molecular chaperone DnaJ [bacterium]|nr:molecular chaperone DnaJ [bacterium]